MAESALILRRMRWLAGDLLLLARADAGREAPRGAVDLAAVASEAAAEAGALSSEHPLVLDLPGPVMIEGGSTICIAWPATSWRTPCCTRRRGRR